MRSSLPAALLLAALALAPAAAEPAPVKVKVSWAYDGIPPGMRLHELKPGHWPLWRTETVAALAESAAGAEVPDSTLRLLPGTGRRLTLLYRNQTSETVYFFAAPHHVHPVQGSLGFKFKCLCTNHVYKVPPGQWWYRVVELRLSRNFAGRALDIKHHLVAVEASKGEAFASGMGPLEVQ